MEVNEFSSLDLTRSNGQLSSEQTFNEIQNKTKTNDSRASLFKCLIKTRIALRTWSNNEIATHLELLLLWFCGEIRQLKVGTHQATSCCNTSCCTLCDLLRRQLLLQRQRFSQKFSSTHEAICRCNGSPRHVAAACRLECTDLKVTL